MTETMPSNPVFRFDFGTTGNFKNRKVKFIRYSLNGYLVEFLPSEEVAEIPEVMRGTRPDVEFVGRKLVPHEELTAALLDGSLDIDESDFVFIDHSQTFKPEFVESLDARPAQDLILRYATVTLMREICDRKGITKRTRAAVAAIEGDIVARLPARIEELEGHVKRLRRHPMRRKKRPENTATAQSILEWDDRLRSEGFASLVDRRHLSGNRMQRLHPIVAKSIKDILDRNDGLENVSTKSLHKRIGDRVIEERLALIQALQERERAGEVVDQAEYDDLERINPPCERTVKEWRSRVAPLVKIFNHKGPDWLLRNQLISGMGLKVDRVGQVVMIDEYEIDLFSIIPFEFLIHWLGHEKIKHMGISESKPFRLLASVMIDAFSGCLTALQFGMTATPELAKRTIMMSMMDKSRLSAACGAEGAWNQFLRAEKLLHDSGNAYLAYVTDAICAQLRIDKMAAPKAKAFIRGVMERVFRTIHEGLLAGIPGKAFSNPVLRGEYDAQAEAVLSLDDLIRVITIWIVDIYHNSPNLGRDGLTPADLWHHEMTEGMGCRPVPGLKTMTHVFGTTLVRQAQARGIRIMHANYSSKEFAKELLRNPARRFRVRWWQENMSEAQVEIRPRVWLPIEVMDGRARGLDVDAWLRVLEREHIERNPDAPEIRRRARDKINRLLDERVTERRKVSRRTLEEADVIRLEERLTRYFRTPTTEITSEQSHGLYGVLVGDFLTARNDGDATMPVPPTQPAKASEKNADVDGGVRKTSTQIRRRGRRKMTGWKPGTME